MIIMFRDLLLWTIHLLLSDSLNYECDSQKLRHNTTTLVWFYFREELNPLMMPLVCPPQMDSQGDRTYI